MDSKEFKNIFSDLAKRNGFVKAFGGWFLESPECIIILDLQMSNFGKYYDLNIKIFVQGIFGSVYTKSKDLFKKSIGNIFRRHPPEFRDVLDLANQMDDKERQQRLESLFNEFIIPFSKKAASKGGIKELANKEQIFILPAVKEALGI